MMRRQERRGGRWLPGVNDDEDVDPFPEVSVPNNIWAIEETKK